MRERERIGHRHIKALRPQAGGDSAGHRIRARRQRSEAIAISCSIVQRRAATVANHRQARRAMGARIARDEARRLLGDVARGEDPAGAEQAIRKAITVAESCGRYLADAKAGLVVERDSARARKRQRLPSTKVASPSHQAGARRTLPSLRHRGRHSKPARCRSRWEDRLSGKNRPPWLGEGARRKGRSNTRAAANRRRLHIRRRAWNAPRQPERGVPQFRDGQRERRLSEAEYRAFR